MGVAELTKSGYVSVIPARNSLKAKSVKNSESLEITLEEIKISPVLNPVTLPTKKDLAKAKKDLKAKKANK